ncbi:prolyl oligopeptidase family serine peptidase [Bacteroides sp. 224]|uniref:S9 family peptidase n=1 Tax=Bacteroides sp. 224 TaxID=2302936 RepID=UPI0013D5B692|nr:prolyl oligopeptidase family serine peptidase [Bacteroides sp. 224]NDV66347.1 S9 family peptidase [Bacteroides sp. 224]
MKKTIIKLSLLSLLLMLFCRNASAQSDIVKEYLHYGPFEVRTPLMIDTVDINKKKFDVKALMTESLPVAAYSGKGDVVKTDEEGTLIINPQKQGYAIGLLTFYLDAPVFCTPELTIKGLPDAAELYLNEKKENLKNGSAKLTLEPVRHELVIKYIAEPNKEYKVKATISDPKGLTPAATTNPSKRYSIYDAVNGRRIQSANISPDGKYYLVHYYDVLPTGKRTENIVLIDSKSNKQTTLKHTGLRWMPTTGKLFYVSESAQGLNLVTVDPSSLEEEVIAWGLPTKQFTISPTEDFIIFSKPDIGPAEKGEVKQVLDPSDRSRSWRNRSSLYRHNLLSGVTERLTFGNTSNSLQDISQDGRYLLFGSWHSDYSDTPFTCMTFCTLDMQTMKADTIVINDRDANRMLFSPDGKELLVLASANAFGGIGANVPEGRIINSYDKQLFLYNIADRKAKALTKDFDPSVKSFIWSDYDNLIYITAENEDRVSLYSINPIKEQITAIATTEDVVSSLSLSRATPELLYYGSGLSNTYRLYTINLKKKQEQLLDDVSAKTLKDVRFGEAGDWNFTSSEGDLIKGRYYLPADFDANKKYPMIVYYYGGTNPTTRRLEGHYSPHIFAGMGFVVYILQPSGTTGFGQEFSSRHVNAWGKRTADEIIEGTTKFCDEHSFVDRKKVGCVGASYGGFMTMYLQTVTDIFAAAISHAGISNISAYWGEGLSGHSYSAIASAGSYPWNAEWLYAGQSPLYNADKINTPLLLLHGTADTNVPVGQSYEMFVALKILKKDVALVVVEGENHGIMKYDNRIKWSNTMYAWFCKWLKDRPEWWESLYPEKELLER